jgi:hypothetical protein
MIRAYHLIRRTRVALPFYHIPKENRYAFFHPPEKKMGWIGPEVSDYMLFQIPKEKWVA